MSLLDSESLPVTDSNTAAQADRDTVSVFRTTYYSQFQM
jgi:hypothetical protein